jgi:hypothetical protein
VHLYSFKPKIGKPAALCPRRLAAWLCTSRSRWGMRRGTIRCRNGWVLQLSVSKSLIFRAVFLIIVLCAPCAAITGFQSTMRCLLGFQLASLTNHLLASAAGG